jgi:hypothetical protein
MHSVDKEEYDRKNKKREELNWTLPVVFDKTDVMFMNIDT